MKKIAAVIVLFLVSVLSVACSGPKAGWTEFSNEDFSFSYPSKWTAATNGGTIDSFKGEGIITVNSFNKKNFWIKPIVRSELIHAGGGLFVNKLPKDGVFLLIMKSSKTGKKSSSAINDLEAALKPYGTPKKFENLAQKAINGLDRQPEEKREAIMKKWTVANDWLHYRIEFNNHGNVYDTHIYLLGDSVKKDKKTAEEIIKSFKLVNPAR